MSQLTGDYPGSVAGENPRAAHVRARKKIDLELVTLRPGAYGGLSILLILAGLAAIAVTVLGAFSTGEYGNKHGLVSYHAGFLYALSIAIGALGLSMIFQQFNAGWAGPVRRQAENIASLFWVPAVLFVPVLVLEVFVFQGKMFKWLSADVVAADVLAQHKQGYLNAAFWAVRAALYFTIWIVLGRLLYRLSRRQDETGDKWLTARARRLSSVGLLIFALSTAFASFDWLMSMDFHWFSTMFGVYFFAGSMVAAIALITLVLSVLKLAGKLGPAFTVEHQHDLGKLLFAFTVFWAYITFCQYFLIWYSNIPEETGFYDIRSRGGWQNVGTALVFGHFLIPFLLMLVRNVKRSPKAMIFVSLWMLVMHAVDLFYIVRPMAAQPELGKNLWLDVFGILGPVLLFVGIIVRRVASAPLIPLKDPRLHEVLEHKNYV
jgi:hypothetical protein